MRWGVKRKSGKLALPGNAHTHAGNGREPITRIFTMQGSAICTSKFVWAGAEPCYASQMHGSARKPISECMVLRCRLENNLNLYFVEAGGIPEFRTLDLHISRERPNLVGFGKTISKSNAAYQKIN